MTHTGHFVNENFLDYWQHLNQDIPLDIDALIAFKIEFLNLKTCQGRVTHEHEEKIAIEHH